MDAPSALDRAELAAAAKILAETPKREKRSKREITPKVPLTPRPKGKRLANLTLRKACVDARIAGLQYWQIAEEQGVSMGTARAHVERWIKEQTPTDEQTEELRQIMLQRLEVLHATYWAKATTGWTAPNGTYYPPDDRAADLLLRLLEREAKIMGVEMQPNTVQITVTAEAIASFLGWDDSAAAVEVIDVLPAPRTTRERIVDVQEAIEAHRDDA